MNNILKEIEKTIHTYFPNTWGSRDTEFFIGLSSFKADTVALDKNLNKPIRDFILRGGKRWRPVLFLTTLKLFGVEYKKHFDIALFLELVHNATLIIDDIEDDAELRRGKPVCHKTFGIDTAVNTGVILHFLPAKILLKKKNLTEKQKFKILKIYTEEVINVYFGQTMDIYWHKNFKNIELDEYLEMCRLKTGGLVRMSVRIAGVLAGKNKRFEDRFKKFAELVGIAFQIKDDALDLSTNKQFGKSYGNDITEGKLSLPVILAFKKLNKKDKQTLKNILRKHTKDRKLLKQAIGIIKKSGAIEESQDYANSLVEEAWQNIEKELPHNKELDVFKELTYFLVKRCY